METTNKPDARKSAFAGRSGADRAQEDTSTVLGHGALLLSMAFLLLTASWLLFCHLGLAPLWKPEGRVAEVVREMFVRHDFIHPTSGWIPHVTKPLLPYWLIVGVSKLAGGLSELTIRIPSAMAAVIAVLSTAVLGMKLFSPRTGFYGAVILCSTYGFVLWGRCGAADMLSLSSIVLSVSWYWWWRERPNIVVAALFGFLLALAAQMKGLVGIAIPLLVIAPDLLFSGRYRSILRPGLVISFLAGLSFYSIPFLVSALSTQVEGFSWFSRAVHESVTRFVHPFDHEGSVWMYTYFVPVWMLPWTPAFLLSLFFSVRDIRVAVYEKRWLIIAILVIFLFFTSAGSRRSYYVLPIIPFCAILTAEVLGTAVEGWKPERMRRVSLARMIIWPQLMFFILVGMAEMAAFVLGYTLLSGMALPSQLLTAMALSGILVLIPCVFTLFYLLTSQRGGSPGYAILSMLITGVLVIGSIFCIQKPVLDHQATEKPFILGVRSYLNRHKEAVPAYFLVGARPRTRLSFYLGRKEPVKVLRSVEELDRFLSTHNSWVIICVREDEKDILEGFGRADITYRVLLEETTHPWEGYPKDISLKRRKKYLAFVTAYRHDPGDIS